MRKIELPEDIFPMEEGSFNHKVSIAGCTECGLSNPVIPGGFVGSPVVIVNGVVGEVEYRTKVAMPSKAPHSKLVERYLEVMGLSNVPRYITYCAFCRSAEVQSREFHTQMCWNQHKPTELGAVLPYAKIILLLGSTAYKTFLGNHAMSSVTKSTNIIYRWRDKVVIGLPSGQTYARRQEVKKETDLFVQAIADLVVPYLQIPS